MMKPMRELTPKEIRSIRKLVTTKCANHDKEYGCLPLDCECPMLNICYTHSAMCSYFRESVLPNDPELSAAFQQLPQQFLPLGIEQSVIHPVLVTPLKTVQFLPGQKPLLPQQLRINKIMIAGKGRERLIG